MSFNRYEYDLARRRECSDWIREHKLSQGCVDCGYAEHPAALDFDHVRGKKVANVSRLVSRGLRVVKREAAKCDVVCANCHRIRTHERQQYGPIV